MVQPLTSGMMWIPGGTFTMGSNRHYPEEAPAHRVTVDGFWMDPFPVTNTQYRHFVQATGQVTFAELVPDPTHYPGARPEMLYAEFAARGRLDGAESAWGREFLEPIDTSACHVGFRCISRGPSGEPPAAA